MPEVFVTGQDGRKYTADVQADDKVKRLREQVGEQAGIPVNKVRLFFEHHKVVVDELQDDQTCGQVGLQRHAELRAGFAVGQAPESTAVLAAMTGVSKAIADLTRLHARCADGMAKLEKKEQALVTRKAKLQQRNGDKKVKDKIKIRTGTMRISTRRSVLRFFPRTRLAALFSGCYDSEFITHDGEPFLDNNSECFRDLTAFLTSCKKASDAGEPLPPLPEGPAGLEDEMAAMLRNYGITAAHEEAKGSAAGDGLSEGQPPSPASARASEATQPEPQEMEEEAEVDWSPDDIKAAAAKVEDAMNRHRAELLAANERHAKLVEEFEVEQQWVRGYVRSTETPELSEVIELEVGGTSVLTTRRVLTLCPESALAQRFAAAADGGRGGAIDGGGEDSSSGGSSDEEPEGGTTVIEEEPQSFLKILDRLRMRAVLGPDEPMPALTVAASKQEALTKVMSVYFSGQEQFILGGVGTSADSSSLELTTVAPVVFEGRQFVFKGVSEEEFDQAGVLNYIATEGGTSAWTNPHKAGRVVVTTSDDNCAFTHPHMMVDGPSKACIDGTGYNRTAGENPGEWMMVDLGATRRLRVDYYALRHGRDDGNHTLQNWELQGANTTKGPWTTLRRHDKDPTIPQQARGTAAWRVDDVAADLPDGGYFRVFRLVIHQPDRYLHCGGIELYGFLIEE